MWNFKHVLEKRSTGIVLMFWILPQSGDFYATGKGPALEAYAE